MSLIDEYDDHDFPQQAVSEMAATFAGKTAMSVAAGHANGQSQQASLELFEKWKKVCRTHNVQDGDRRKALILQGQAQFIEDSKERSLAELADKLEDV